MCVVPKADDPALLEPAPVTRRHVGLVALVESARGVVGPTTWPGPRGGPAGVRLDRLRLDVDAAEDDESLLLARLTLVLASRAAGETGPIEGITRSLDNAELIGAESQRSRRLGFTGKLCIHPAQLEPVANGLRSYAAGGLPGPQERACCG